MSIMSNTNTKNAFWLSLYVLPQIAFLILYPVLYIEFQTYLKEPTTIAMMVLIYLSILLNAVLYSVSGVKIFAEYQEDGEDFRVVLRKKLKKPIQQIIFGLSNFLMIGGAIFITFNLFLEIDSVSWDGNWPLYLKSTLIASIIFGVFLSSYRMIKNVRLLIQSRNSKSL